MLTGNETSDTIKAALMAVLIAVCAWISVPVEIPFTMQTFGVFLALRLLRGKYGTVSILVYILLGLIGAPVFSGFSSGAGVLLGPTGGYIIGFLFCGMIYAAFEPRIVNRLTENAVLAAGLIICYLFGTLWFIRVMALRGNIYSLLQASLICVIPYIIPDLCKLALSQFAAERIIKLSSSSAKNQEPP